MLYQIYDDYIRISKPTAKKLHKTGDYDIIVTPNNMTPDEVSNSTIIRSTSNFDGVVEAFVKQNCNSNKTGKYAAFWIKG